MKIAHFVEKGLPSGLGHTATHLCEIEKKMGLDSVLIDCYKEENGEAPEDAKLADEADIYVVHLYLGLKRIYDGKPKIWVAHGTPEVMLQGGYLEAAKGHYAPADSLMLAQWWLQNSDVVVTFWPRHEAIWRSLVDKRTRVEGVPLGCDLSFWKPIESVGKFAGEPSVFTAENHYELKWPYDLFISWPWIVQNGLPKAKLHAVNVPMDQSRMWFPLVNRNGAGYHTYLTNRTFTHTELRNAFVSTDFYANLVRYADHNYIGLQAAASGAKVISYKGNPYASHWIDYGDQRIMAQQLGAILKGEVEERHDRERPVGLSRTAECFHEIYLSLGKDSPTGLREHFEIPVNGELATLAVN